MWTSFFSSKISPPNFAPLPNPSYPDPRNKAIQLLPLYLSFLIEEGKSLTSVYGEEIGCHFLIHFKARYSFGDISSGAFYRTGARHDQLQIFMTVKSVSDDFFF